MKKIIAFLLMAIFLVSICSASLACNHSSIYWDYYDTDDMNYDYYRFWVPSCPGHPWPHYHTGMVYHIRTVYKCRICNDYNYSAVKNKIGPDFCDYDN